MERIRIGIIGCGNISGIYLKNLTTRFNRTVEVYAVADLIQEREDYAAETYGIPHKLKLEQQLEDPNIDLILNLTTPPDHYWITKAALLAGKHAYAEKPFSLTKEQGNELLAIAEQKGLLVGNAPDTFLGAGIQTCRKAIDDGLIGEPIGATAFMMCHGHETWHPDPAFYYKVGGGPMFDMGPYYLTALVSLLGPAAEVCGMTAITFPTRTITSQPKYGAVVDVEVPTHVAGCIKFCSGAIATMITTFDVWDSTLPRIEIYGTRGTLVVPDPNTFGGPVQVKTYFGGGFETLPLTHVYSENSRGLGVTDLARCIRTGETPRANGRMANHVLELMHAFHTSAETGTYEKLRSTCERPAPLPLGLLDGELG